MIGAKLASHPVGIVSGVEATDSRVEAAEKAVATMKLAGFPKNEIKKAERMLEQIRAKYGSK